MTLADSLLSCATSSSIESPIIREEVDRLIGKVEEFVQVEKFSTLYSNSFQYPLTSYPDDGLSFLRYSFYHICLKFRDSYHNSILFPTLSRASW